MGIIFTFVSYEFNAYFFKYKKNTLSEQFILNESKRKELEEKKKELEEKNKMDELIKNKISESLERIGQEGLKTDLINYINDCNILDILNNKTPNMILEELFQNEKYPSFKQILDDMKDLKKIINNFKYYIII